MSSKKIDFKDNDQNFETGKRVSLLRYSLYELYNERDLIRFAQGEGSPSNSGSMRRCQVKTDVAGVSP